MNVYHGSSTLNDGSIPSAGPKNGAFFSLNIEFAKIFGRRIHQFQIDDSLILDFRNNKHIKLIHDKQLVKIYKKVELAESSGLPYAFNHVVEIASLESVKELALALGFSGAYFHETNKFIGVEIWDTSCLCWVQSEDNPDFDALNT